MVLNKFISKQHSKVKVLQPHIVVDKQLNSCFTHAEAKNMTPSAEILVENTVSCSTVGVLLFMYKVPASNISLYITKLQLLETQL